MCDRETRWEWPTFPTPRSRPSVARTSTPGVALEDAAFLQLGIICGQGVRRAAVEQGEAVCVIGAGLIGVLAQRIASATGAGETTIVAASRAKERVARAGGAHFLALEADLEEIERLSAPVVIEATGDPKALSLAVDVAADGGRVILLGSPRGTTIGFPADRVRAKRLRLVGAHVATLAPESAASGIDCHAREAQSFLDLLADRELAVADLVDDVVDPREGELFYRRLARDKSFVGARFDWTLIRDEQTRGASLLRPPDLRGRGADAARPLPLSRAGGAGPFAGAEGRLRIGLVGCGDVSGQKAAAMQLAPNVELVASRDPVRPLAEDVAAAYGGEVEASCDALLERADVDAVLLSVPHHLHLPLGEQAAAVGKHLIVENPLANDLESATRLVEVAEAAGVVLSVCFPQRFDAAAVEARRLIAEGALGEVTGVLLTFWMDKPPSYWVGGYSGRAPSSWRESREQAGGGVLIMNLSHYVDLIRHLTGLEAELVLARAEPEDPTAEVEDAVSVTVRYGSRAVGTLCASAALRGPTASSELRLWGTHGQVVVEPRPLLYTLRALPGVRAGRWHSYASDAGANARAVYLSRLATAIARGEPCDVDARDGLAVQAFIDAAYRSSETGEGIVPAQLPAEARP